MPPGRGALGLTLGLARQLLSGGDQPTLGTAERLWPARGGRKLHLWGRGVPVWEPLKDGGPSALRTMGTFPSGGSFAFAGARGGVSAGHRRKGA